MTSGISVARSLVWRLALPAPITLGLGFILAWIFIPIWVENHAREDAVRSATQTVNQFKILRAYYTDNVVKKALADGGLRVTFDHASDPNAIPLPATVIHDLSALLENEDTSIALYSNYPFPHRRDRVLDDFQTEAWQFLNANPDQVLAKTVLRDGREIVRVAIADKMVAQTCVACHNSHPDTPKVGWRVGDVRGILEVAKDIEPSLLAGQEPSQAILWMIVIAGEFSFL